MLISHDLLSHSGTPCVAALGFFDGVHLGHRAVIGRARALATAKNVACGLFTFEPPAHTARVVSKSDVRLLQSVGHRQEIMQKLGVELLVCPAFESFYNLTPQEFVRQLLHEAMHCVAVVCGEDYHFGQKGSGDVPMLRTLCAQYGIEVETVPAVCYEGGAVSSTRIRACLANGELRLANSMLCEPFRIEAQGTNCEGKLWQNLPSGMMPPAEGRYHSGILTEEKLISAETVVRMQADTVIFSTETPENTSVTKEQFYIVQLLEECEKY